MSHKPYRLAVAAAIVAAIAAAGSRALSQTALTEDAGGKNGLWLDSDGEYWCGGTCAPGQKCCSIHP